MDKMLSKILECMGTAHGAGKALADHLGVSPNVITNWKNGSNRSYRKHIKEIAEFYGVPVDYFLDDNQNADPIPSDEIGWNDFTYALYHETKALTPENREKLLEMARFFNQQQEQGK